MRALPFLATLLCTATFAGASELELLQSRVSEQERTIRQLEQENSRLKSLVGTAAATPAVKEAVPSGNSAPTHATVRAGDTLAKVAKRHGTTSATLIQLNKLKNPSLIRPGDKLRLPGRPAAAPAAPAGGTSGKTHVVKSGETFYSIARKHGIGPDALQAANPSIKATALRPGQTLQLASRSDAPRLAREESPAPKPAAPATGTPAPSVAPQVAAKPAAPAPVESAAQTVASTPRINSVFITEETDFSAFAAAHGTSTAKLNALNGLNLNPSTVLAKGSELYVPAQP